MKTTRARTVRVAALILALAACAQAGWSGEAPSPEAPRTADEKLAAHLLDLTQRRAGLCAMPALDEINVAKALAARSALTVHGMVAQPEALARFQAELMDEGWLGRRVYLDEGRPAECTLARWTADLLLMTNVTDARLSELSPEWLRRVCSPYRGVAALGHRAPATGLTRSKLESWVAASGLPDARVVEDAHGLWAIVRMPALEGADEWTHFLGTGANNPVSTDTALKPPYDVQYVTPPFIGAGGSSRVSGGRFYEMEGHQNKFSAVFGVKSRIWCRNAYNGEILWQKPLPKHVEAKRPIAVARGEGLYIAAGAEPAVELWDGETGAARRIAFGGEGECKWLAVEQEVLLALTGPVAPPFEAKATYHGKNPNVDETREGKLNHGQRLYAYDLKGSRLLWEKKLEAGVVDPRSIAAWDGKVAYLAETPEFEIKGTNESVQAAGLFCLHLRTGRELWANREVEPLAFTRRYQFIFGREWVPGLIASKEALRLRLTGIGQNDLYFFDPDDGRLLWKLDAKAAPSGFAGYFQDGRYWHHNYYNARTGKLEEDRAKQGGGCGIRCASPAGVFGNVARDVLGETLKADCHVGLFVGNGLLHAPRGWCACDRVWLGTVAFSSRPEGAHAAFDDTKRLWSGDVSVADPLPVDARDWPAYRRDNRRGAASPATVDPQAQVLWHRKPARPFAFSTQYELFVMERQEQPVEPVAAGGLIFVGGSDGILHALDGKSGEPRWRYACGGRLYAPPSIWNGRIYAAGGDGRVHCLEARSGRKLWHFDAAPARQRIMLQMHLAGRWPILGGTLVHATGADDATVCFAAGLASKQGVRVYALDARTGQVRWCDAEAGAGQSELLPGYSPSGFLAAYGSKLLLRSADGLPTIYDLATGQRQPWPDLSRRKRHFQWNFASAGREIAVLGDGFVLSGGRDIFHELNQRSGDRGYGSFQLQQFSEAGELLRRVQLKISQSSILPPAFDEAGVALIPGGCPEFHDNGRLIKPPGPHGTMGLAMLHAPAFQEAVGRDFESCHRVFMEAMEKQKDGPSHALVQTSMLKEEGDFARFWVDKAAPGWMHKNRFLQVNAVVLSRNAVVITRGVQKLERGVPGVQFEGWKVAAFERKDGAALWEHDLPCEPMLNGLCIDRDGRVIVSLRDGGVVCVGAKAE